MTVRCPLQKLCYLILPPMASSFASLFPTTSSVFRPDFFFSPTSNFRRTPISIPTRRLAESIYADQALSSSIPAPTSPTSADWSLENNRLEQKTDAAESAVLNSVPRDERRRYMVIEEPEFEERSLKDYFDRSSDFIRSDGGPPRWFSPLECAAHSSDSPLLLFLPGIDGVGLGLTKHHQRLGKIYDVWCLHIPVRDRTPLTDLIKLVEKTIRLENQNAPNRPIYLVGESLGACLALSVAAHNPDMDLVLILTNPATCFSKSQMEYLIPLLEVMPDAYHFTLPYILNLMKGDLSRTVMTSLEEGQLLQHAVGRLSQDIVGMSSYLSVLAEILPRETLIWKMQMLKSASAFANARLHAVKAQTLIICSGKDQLLPSVEEGERLSRFLPKCEIRRLNNSGHFLLLEDGVELLSIIKAARFYRRSKNLDYVSDYILPTPSEFRKIYEPYRWLNLATSPVMISTLGNGNIVRGAGGIPSEGPVLLVGYHMLLGLELVPLVGQLFSDRNILVRGIAHPMMFTKLKEGMLPELSSFDTFRMMGAVPVSATNFYKLFSSKSHVLLYPGGMREALHRKGEKYKLFWPEQSEFVRMAARFGAKIVPFGAVGEDDIGEVIFDYDDQMKIPYLKSFIERLTDEAANVRVGVDGEVGNQDVHCPWILPKLPGRFYYYFGSPIETEGRKQELRDREKAHELYLEVKREVERCLEYLKKKRESDPYRSLWPRLLYHSRHGINSEVPTFHI